MMMTKATSLISIFFLLCDTMQQNLSKKIIFIFIIIVVLMRTMPSLPSSLPCPLPCLSSLLVERAS